ncbi:DUF3515 domain-containing protein [Actinophytocola xanthii]|uniref:DUF3515 domain-containing protein n=1 Tax=Actinophytocola xanthii TaxID=1912961 RepID=A0A1Q8CWK2_9PSEU|nr:DUF3515 domain-containing protein [Actinophytocola xanthii]OLF18725.1 hypothetical protein BU204_04215 [Actinophytocola xanthii]
MSEQQLSPVALRVSVALVALLVVGVAVLGLTARSDPATDAAVPTSTPAATSGATDTGPLALSAVDAPAAASAECAALVGRLPRELPSGDRTLRRLPLADPAPPAAAAWGEGGGEPVVLRCGMPRPADLTPISDLREISGVRWLMVPGDGAVTWFVVDRAVYVALTVPEGSGTGVLQDVSAAVRAALAVRPVRAG